ncbi:MAG: hypothetical protein MMC33_000125 [Icmadophila ericetorum]|nr:hypothetical protein [Icmadophila ericetorum]
MAGHPTGGREIPAGATRYGFNDFVDYDHPLGQQTNILDAFAGYPQSRQPGPCSPGMPVLGGEATSPHRETGPVLLRYAGGAGLQDQTTGRYYYPMSRLDYPYTGDSATLGSGRRVRVLAASRETGAPSPGHYPPRYTPGAHEPHQPLSSGSYTIVRDRASLGRPQAPHPMIHASFPYRLGEPNQLVFEDERFLGDDEGRAAYIADLNARRPLGGPYFG